MPQPVVETEPEPVVEPVVEPVIETVIDPEPVVEPVVETVEAPALVTDPELTVAPEGRPDAMRTAKRTRPSGRRVATRRARIPSLPLLAGVAVLAISAGGALQAMHPGLAGTDADGHLSPAGALSGSSAVSSANVLGGRGTVVSRDSDRQAQSGAGSLQAAADAQAKQRDQALSEFAAEGREALRPDQAPPVGAAGHARRLPPDRPLRRLQLAVVALPHRPRLRGPHRHPDHGGRRRHHHRGRLLRRLRQPHHRDCFPTAPSCGTATRTSSAPPSARRSSPAR